MELAGSVHNRATKGSVIQINGGVVQHCPLTKSSSAKDGVSWTTLKFFFKKYPPSPGGGG